jgi:uncharacterized membrane protein YbhN (UPF0104 family)
VTKAGIGRRAALIVVGTLVGFGLLALALGGRWTALTHAVAAVPLVTIAAAALLQLASLVARLLRGHGGARVLAWPLRAALDDRPDPAELDPAASGRR